MAGPCASTTRPRVRLATSLRASEVGAEVEAGFLTAVDGAVGVETSAETEAPREDEDSDEVVEEVRTRASAGEAPRVGVRALVGSPAPRERRRRSARKARSVSSP